MSRDSSGVPACLRLGKMTFSISTRISVAFSASSEIADDFPASFDQRVFRQLMPSELTPQGHRDLDMLGWITVVSYFSSCNVRHSLPLSFFLLLLSAGVCSGQWRVRGKTLPNYLLLPQYLTTRKVKPSSSVFFVLKKNMQKKEEKGIPTPRCFIFFVE